MKPRRPRGREPLATVYRPRLDKRRRFILPREFRGALARQARRCVVLSAGKVDAVNLYLAGAFDQCVARIRRRSREGYLKSILRALMCASVECAADPAGRITLHRYLWHHAGRPQRVSVRIIGEREGQRL